MLAPHAPEAPPWTRTQVIGAALLAVCLSGIPVGRPASIPSRDGTNDPRVPGTVLLYQETLEVNAAPREDLETLPGIGPAKARRLIAERDRVGGFCALEEARRAAGIGARDWTRAARLIRLALPPRCSSSLPG